MDGQMNKEASYRMKDVEKAWTRRQPETLTQTVKTPHGEEHGDRRSESKKRARLELELRITNPRHSGTASANHKINRSVGC
jgi:hypothetical protein